MNLKDLYSLVCQVMRKMDVRMTMIGCSKHLLEPKSLNLEIMESKEENRLIKTIIVIMTSMADWAVVMTITQIAHLLTCQQK